MRERHGRDTVNVGFTTYTGTVTAASEWGAAAERKRVRPALAGSYEALFHATRIAGLPAVPAGAGDSGRALREPRLERAIGVIYRPETERQSHWFAAERRRAIRRAGPPRLRPAPSSRWSGHLGERRTTRDLPNRALRHETSIPPDLAARGRNRPGEKGRWLQDGAVATSLGMLASPSVRLRVRGFTGEDTVTVAVDRSGASRTVRHSGLPARGFIHRRRRQNTPSDIAIFSQAPSLAILLRDPAPRHDNPHAITKWRYQLLDERASCGARTGAGCVNSQAVKGDSLKPAGPGGKIERARNHSDCVTPSHPTVVQDLIRCAMSPPAPLHASGPDQPGRRQSLGAGQISGWSAPKLIGVAVDGNSSGRARWC